MLHDGQVQSQWSLQQPALQPVPVMARASRARVVIQQEKGQDRAVASGDKGKGPIALLQEFVQASKEFSLPANCKILQWSFDDKMVDANLEFRATVRFLLDAVPHHATGTWQSGKAAAKRDAAHRALGLFVTCWGEVVESESLDGASGLLRHSVLQQPQADVRSSEADDVASVLHEAEELAYHAGPLSWSHEKDGQDYVAFVQLRLLGVPHTFKGGTRHSLVEACRATACCVLWYLQCPGFSDSLEPDFALDSVKDIPEAPQVWIKQGSPENEEKEVAKQKTLLMRLQNRLQQAYSKQIEVGTSAIKWSFERSSSDRNNLWTAHIRATANIPAVNKSFMSTWKRTRFEAQTDACNLVSLFLDEEGLGEEAHGGRSRNGSGL